MNSQSNKAMEQRLNQRSSTLFTIGEVQFELPLELQEALSQLSAAQQILVSPPSTTRLSSRASIVSADEVAPVETPTAEDYLQRPKDLVRKWPSLLMRLMYDNEDDEWEPVFQRIASHPHEIGLRGVNGGQTAMHAACVRYPPTRIIQAMVEADSATALVQNFSGETALHLASYSASEEVQTILVKAQPAAAALADQYGDLPLHFAARNGATIPLMEELLRASPESISVRNKRGVTPLWLLPRSYLEAEDMDEVLEEDADDDYYDDWQLLVLFLRYSYFGAAAANMNAAEIRDYESWIVHAAAATPSTPRLVLKFLCRMFPNASLRKRSGLTPLLLACQAPEVDEPAEWDENEDGFREHVQVAEGDIHDGNSVDESVMALKSGDQDFLKTQILEKQDSVESVIDILLEWSPASASAACDEGSLPLAHALRSGQAWKNVRALMAACPRAVEMRDAKTNLYMFQLAAESAPDLDSTWSLLRSWPELVCMTHRRRSEEEEPLPSTKRMRLC